MAKVGRPRIQLDWDEIAKLCGIHCTQEEIASFVGCSLDTIERDCERTHGINFADFHKQKKGIGRVSIRRKQYALAEMGDKTMLIWLGKQWLGQAERIDQFNSAEEARTHKDATDDEIDAALKGRK